MREIEWRDQSPEGPELLPLDWEAFRRSRSLQTAPPPGPVAVFVSRDALAAARAHAQSSREAEVGGILFGRTYRNRDLTAVDVVAAVPARGADGTPAHLRFTREAWDHVFARQAALEEGLLVVGWYHTHPALGVFLSWTDLRTHEAFFPAPWQVALVLDPVSAEEGAFLAGGAPVPLGIYSRREPVLPPAALAEPASRPPAPRPAAQAERSTLGAWIAAAAGLAAVGLALYRLAKILQASRLRRD